MMVNKPGFENLDVWKKSMRLVVEIYKELGDCRDYGLRDQLQRSAVSIPSNIAEGHDRNSNRDFIRFLNIARGSCAELRTQLYIAREIGILNQVRAIDFLKETQKVSAMIYNLIKVRAKKL